jgi:hypothetical protein
MEPAASMKDLRTTRNNWRKATEKPSNRLISPPIYWKKHTAAYTEHIPIENDKRCKSASYTKQGET